MNIFANIFFAKVHWSHFLIRAIGIFITLGFLFYALLPILLYGVFEDTALDKFFNNIFIGNLWNLLPLFAGLFFVFSNMKREVRIQEFSKAKSYLLIGILLGLLYPIRFLIIKILLDLNLEIIQ